MATNEKHDGFATACLVGAMFFMTLSFYYQLAPVIVKMGVPMGAVKVLNGITVTFRSLLKNSYIVRLIVLVLLLGSAMMKTNKANEKPIRDSVIWSVVGTILIMLPLHGQGFWYPLAVIAGTVMCIYGYGGMFHHVGKVENPEDGEFLQFDEKIDTEDSINIPYHYTFEKKVHHAWINLVAPFRASIVMGVPGSGKSFAIYNKCIEDMVRKGYSFFLYDYKFPDLTEELLTEIYFQKIHENLWEKDKVKPKLYILNFDDPLRSNRCNPIHHSYITDPADTTEIADLLFKNINKGTSSKGFDFFNESAKVYLDAIAWYLANYDPDAIYDSDQITVIGSSKNYVNKGKYCTFPHIIEMMAVDYKKTFQILQFTKGLEAKISPFASALEGGAMEQLQGQIASAQIPLGKFVSPALYWIMTGDDFTLDINNPEAPKIVCMGNNPDRQSIYGSAIALYTSRMFKLINHKHKRKCAVLLDELPTVFIKGLDNLIATARSNKVAIILGAQDRSQLKRDYGDDEAKVIFSTVGNVLSGQVNEETAEALSKMFGKEFREQASTSMSMDGGGNDSRSISYHQLEIMPASKISTLTQGMFFGRIADNFETPIDRKLFCGAIDVDLERAKEKRKVAQKVPIMTDFFQGKKPEMTEKQREELKRKYPEIAEKEDKLLQKYISEYTNDVIQKNFQQVKKDVKDIVENEFKRTKPLADAYKAEHEDAE